MSTRIARLVTGVAAAGLAVVALAPAASAQVYPVSVSGEAQCERVGSLGGPGQYVITWTVENGGGLSLAIDSATESGAADADVTITPNPIPALQLGEGPGSTLGGTTNGSVTLTVQWTAGGSGTLPGTSGESSGIVELAGTCLFPPPDPGSSTTSSSSTSTSVSSNSGNAATANAAAVTPRFTG